MANKITVLLDLVTDKATSAAKGFKSSIAEAEGAANKFKAGASSAFATVQANAGALALGAGSALAAFGAKSIATFQETALAAGKFSDATGIAVEDASRLQEVAGDLGVNTDALAGSLSRFQKAVASNSSAVKTLGLEVQHTKDGQVDVNATFLEAIDKLGGVEDANQKALLASQLFGKGFADSAELILGNAADIQKRLDEVSDAQVISAEQVERARKFRDQMDDLADKLKQVEIVVGDQLVPVIGDLADNLVFAEEKATDLLNTLNEIPGVDIESWAKRSFGLIPNPLNQIKTAVDDIRGSMEGTFTPARQEVDRFRDSVIEAADSTSRLDAATEAMSARWDAASIPLEAASGAFAELGVAAEDAGTKAADSANDWNVFEDGLRKNTDIVDALTGKINDLRGVLDLTDLLDSIQEQFDNVAEAAKDATDPEGARKFRDETRRLQGQLLDLLETLKNIPAEKRTEIIAEIATGDLDTLHRALDDLSKGIVIPVSFATAPTPGFESANVAFNTTAGTIVPRLNNPNPAPINNSQTTIINPVGSSPTTTNIDQNLYNTRNGPR